MSKRTVVSKWRIPAIWLGLAALLNGCGTYVPDGATVIALKNSKRDFERGELRPPENELQSQAVIKMRWYDDNTFLTTATLRPGVYSFMARNFDGSAVQRDVAIEEGKDYYEVSADVASSDEAEKTPEMAGPEVRGRILSSQAARISAISVLFIGNEIVLKTARVERDGSFKVDAPQTGNWKIEVHRLGASPVSYVHPVTNISKPLDLGAITLR